MDSEVHKMLLKVDTLATPFLLNNKEYKPDCLRLHRRMADAHDQLSLRQPPIMGIEMQHCAETE
jgi:hypothetical protein